MPQQQFLFVHVNKRCNLRCQHCKFWMVDDGDRMNYLPWERKRDILGEFSELSPGGRVVICGGESMLDLEDNFAIAVECRRVAPSEGQGLELVPSIAEGLVEWP